MLSYSIRSKRTTPEDALVKRDFHCLYAHEFMRIAAAVPTAGVGDPVANAAAILGLARQADEAKAALVVFPELSLSSYAIDDLLHQDALLKAVEQQIGEIAQASKALYPMLIIGAPLRAKGRLYNTAVVIHRGEILGVVSYIRQRFSTSTQCASLKKL